MTKLSTIKTSWFQPNTVPDPQNIIWPINAEFRPGCSEGVEAEAAESGVRKTHLKFSPLMIIWTGGRRWHVTHAVSFPACNSSSTRRSWNACRCWCAARAVLVTVVRSALVIRDTTRSVIFTVHSGIDYIYIPRAGSLQCGLRET